MSVYFHVCVKVNLGVQEGVYVTLMFENSTHILLTQKYKCNHFNTCFGAIFNFWLLTYNIWLPGIFHIIVSIVLNLFNPMLTHICYFTRFLVMFWTSYANMDQIKPVLCIHLKLNNHSTMINIIFPSYIYKK